MQNKDTLVRKIFSQVANKYDVMNDVMSLGMHRLWKKTFIECFSDYSKSLLDMASGTCDIAISYHQKASFSKQSPKIVVCDINADMLNIGRDKLIDHNILSDINLVQGDAMNLPFAANSFEHYAIAFGIRNLSDISLALREAHRVLKPEGRFLCLEFSKPQILANAYEAYSQLIPLMGKIIANNKQAYQYLVDSIRAFPNQNTFSAMIKEAGFSNVTYTNLSAGIVCIHSAYK
jgi:ubiquinone/menaquinone biosynthesis methyltransferase